MALEEKLVTWLVKHNTPKSHLGYRTMGVVDWKLFLL